jgi:DNA-binding transcriptional LysR family regulator
MLDRQHLRYFLAVVETGNFTRAAGRLNVTQPTLSTGIAKLEAAVGARLFFRNSQRVQLTEAGGRLLPHARDIEKAFHAIEGAKPAGETVTLRLGVLATIPAALLERLVTRQRQGGRFRLEIVEGPDRELNAQLDRGRIDLALTLQRQRQERFAFEPLAAEGYSLVVPVWHRLAQAGSVEGEELRGEVMIVRRHCEVLSDLSRYFTSRAVRPEFALRSDNDERVLAMVRAGLGVTIMPDSYQDPGIRQVKVRGLELQRTLGLLSAPPVASPEAAGALAEDLAAVFGGA